LVLCESARNKLVALSCTKSAIWLCALGLVAVPCGLFAGLPGLFVLVLGDLGRCSAGVQIG